MALLKPSFLAVQYVSFVTNRDPSGLRMSVSVFVGLCVMKTAGLCVSVKMAFTNLCIS